MGQWSSSSGLRGLTLVDTEGAYCGRVEATFPFDGGTPEFVVVRMGRFGLRTFVPLEDARRIGFLLQVPYPRFAVEDAPTIDSVRYLDDAVSRSRGYWSTVDGDAPSALAPMPLG